jgi:hypothetical protein
MILTQNAMGVNPLTSTAIALAYRGITFWLTFAYGFIAIRMIGFRRDKPSAKDASLDKPDEIPSSEIGVIEKIPDSGSLKD